jgi:hypothetical protein
VKGRAVSCSEETAEAYLYGLPEFSVDFVASASEMSIQNTFGPELVGVGSCIDDVHDEAENCCYEHDCYLSMEASNKPLVMDR